MFTLHNTLIQISTNKSVHLKHLTLLLKDHLKTIQNFHFQKCPLVLHTHGDTIWTVLVAVLPFRSIQMVLEGPLIHHLEVSKQGFVLAVLPSGKIPSNKVLY